MPKHKMFQGVVVFCVGATRVPSVKYPRLKLTVCYFSTSLSMPGRLDLRLHQV